MFGALIAQGDAITGGAGWAGAGLLGLVLGWLLLKHLPDKDKHDAEKDDLLRKMIAERDVAVSALVQVFKEEVREQRNEQRGVLDRICEEFRNDCQAERLACEKNFQTIARAIENIAMPNSQGKVP